MKITLESTYRFVEVNGVRCRQWEGATERGVKVHALIPVLAVASTDDQTQFEAELEQTRVRAPSLDGAKAFDARMVL